MSLKKYLNRVKPCFEEGGKLHAFESVYDGFEAFLYVPNKTSSSGTNIHDSIDSKRIMILVVIALMPALLFGMYNVGYQNYMLAASHLGHLAVRVSGHCSVMASWPYCRRSWSVIL